MLLIFPGFGQLLIIVILWPFLLNVDDKFMRTDSAPLNNSEYKKFEAYWKFVLATKHIFI